MPAVDQLTPTRFVVVTNLVVTAEATAWTPAAGKKFRLMGWFFWANAAVGLTIRDSTAGTIIARSLVRSTAEVVAPVPIMLGNGILSAAANNVLTITGDVAATITGMIFGIEETP